MTEEKALIQKMADFNVDALYDLGADEFNAITVDVNDRFRVICEVFKLGFMRGKQCHEDAIYKVFSYLWEVQLAKTAERLRLYRGAETIDEVAEAAGVSKSTIAAYENGELVPCDEVKVKLAKHFGVTPRKLFVDGMPGYLGKQPISRTGSERAELFSETAFNMMMAYIDPENSAMTEYEWKVSSLYHRIKHFEEYMNYEDAPGSIERLWEWLEGNRPAGHEAEREETMRRMTALCASEGYSFEDFYGFRLSA